MNDRYRCLAGVHHERCGPNNAVRNCFWTIKIFSADTNRVALQNELRWASKLPNEHWPQPGPIFKLSPIWFPFIATCLIQGATNSWRDTPSTTASIPLSAAGSLDGIPWESGITVIDITDLAKLKYCLARRHKDRNGHLNIKMLSVDRFFRSLNQSSPPGRRQEMRSFLETVKQLEAIPLYSLWSAWPTDRWDQDKWPTGRRVDALDSKKYSRNGRIPQANS